MANICVFSGSAEPVKDVYVQAAEELGMLLGQQQHTLVYGGSERSLMGAVARATKKYGGHVVAVLPRMFWHLSGLEHELVKVEDLSTRKVVMIDRSDGFIALPGGIGTVDEISDVMATRKLRCHSKHMVILNTSDYFTHLRAHFDHSRKEGFMAYGNRNECCFVDTPQQAIDSIVLNGK